MTDDTQLAAELAAIRDSVDAFNPDARMASLSLFEAMEALWGKLPAILAALTKPAVPDVREALQSAWDAVATLPPIDFTETEGVALAQAFEARLRTERNCETSDWWKPEPGDPFWMLEVCFGDEQGAWLRNKHSYMTTRDPSKALRYPSQWTADIARRGLGGNQDGRFKPTEHTWITATAPCCEAERERCAKIAEEHFADQRWDSAYSAAGNRIATAIRGADQ